MSKHCEACIERSRWASLAYLEEQNYDYVMYEQGWSTGSPHHDAGFSKRKRHRHSELCKDFSVFADGEKCRLCKKRFVHKDMKKVKVDGRKRNDDSVWICVSCVKITAAIMKD